MSLKLGTSGVRGTYVDLTPQIAAELSEAFSTYMDGGCIALATDYDVPLPEASTSLWSELKIVVLKSRPMLALRVGWKYTWWGKRIRQVGKSVLRRK